MERPPKKYVCEKCGYLGDTSEHEGCDYLAWTTGEQLYIDQLERELALLKASPASAPEGWKLVPVVPTHAILDVMFDAGIDRHDGDLTILYRAILAAAPTPPVSEDRKDAERYRVLKSGDFSVEQFVSSSYGWKFVPMEELDAAIDKAMQEDKP